MPKNYGKDVLRMLDENCGNRDYRCWNGGIQQAVRQAQDEPKKVAEHLLEHHNLRAGKVNGSWWILD